MTIFEALLCIALLIFSFWCGCKYKSESLLEEFLLFAKVLIEKDIEKARNVFGEKEVQYIKDEIEKRNV
jgi:hypothetical protein